MRTAMGSEEKRFEYQKAWGILLKRRAMKELRWFLACVVTSATVYAANRAEFLNRLPLRFEENRGRDAHAGTRYIARAQSFSLGLAPTGSWLEWKDSKGTKTATIHTRLVGGNPDTKLAPADRLPGAANYFLGSGSQWQSDVTGFGRIRYSGVYSGIDLVFHGEEHRLEYDFIVAPYADPRAIQLEISGQRSLTVEDGGDLVISTDAGEIRWKRPEIYQEIKGVRHIIDGRFRVVDSRVTFEIAAYDRTKELVIDPTLKYSTYLGATANDGSRGIGLDSAGNVYIVGNTTSQNLPTISAVQPAFGGMTSNFMNGDAFVAKFSPAGALIYLTYLGGSGDDAASAVAVDGAGNAYVVGLTTSQNFPTANPVQPNFGGQGGRGFIRTGDAFAAKLNPSGNKLIYSTYLGGNQDDAALAVAIDNAGDAFIAGVTSSMNFPLTSNAYQSFYRGGLGEPINALGYPQWDPGDAFILELNPAGSQILYSTYFGGTSDDAALSIALDSSSNVYIGGCTISPDLPTTSGALQRGFGGVSVLNKHLNFGDGFVAKFTSAGALSYSTYFGAEGDDCVSSIAVDGTGSVYMTGSTSSMFLKTTPGALQPLYSGYSILPKLISLLYGDAFVAKLNPAGSALTYLTYLGGSRNDGGMAIAVDAGGNAYVTGFTDSTDFNLAGASLQLKMAGDGQFDIGVPYGDAFLSVVNPTGTALLYSSYYGGNFDDIGGGIALDGAGGVYITGSTGSTSFPTTSNAAQPAYGGKGQRTSWVHGDAFYASFTGFSLSGPSVTKVANAEGESLIIAANTWVEIKGSGLSTTSRTWQDSDFVGNNMPTSLDGVSVTMNGEKAYVYFISGTQINVLTPSDLAPGTVQVVVNNTNGSSAAFPIQAQAISPSFFIFGSGPYVVGTHANGNLIGPTTLYPGLTTPAAAGESVVLYMNGFGPVAPPVIPGSATQSGTLPTKPQILIANTPVTVTFAGLISPGLYQFNITIAPGTPVGDDFIVVNYNNVSTALGPIITIQ
jgi:uncharacterized protein (TIGR03437 family)